jgi:hypothetical protein
LSAPARSLVEPHDLKLKLGKPTPFAAALVDGDGTPIRGAKVRIETVALSVVTKEIEGKGGDRTSIMTCFDQIPRAIVEGSPVEASFVAETDASGSFRFENQPQGVGLKLDVRGPDGRAMWIKLDTARAYSPRSHMAELGFLTAPPGEANRLVAVQSARIEGRVVSKVPGLGVSGLTARYGSSRPPEAIRPTPEFGGTVPVDKDGRFTFDGLGEGFACVYVHGAGENEQWTYRAAKDVALILGKTTEVTLELIRGVEVGGTVTERVTGKPIEGADIGVYGPFRPLSQGMTHGARTDATGRFRYRLPSGETNFYVMGPPDGFKSLLSAGSFHNVPIPEGIPIFELPPIELAVTVKNVRGKVVDPKGAPVAGATVVGLCEGGYCDPIGGTEAITDTRGEFRLPPAWNNKFAVNETAKLKLRLSGGAEHEVAIVPAEDGVVVVKLPVAVEAP